MSKLIEFVQELSRSSKKTTIVFLILLVVMLLFPPVFSNGGSRGSYPIGYEFIAKNEHSIYAAKLFVQILILAICYVILASLLQLHQCKKANTELNQQNNDVESKQQNKIYEAIFDEDKELTYECSGCSRKLRVPRHKNGTATCPTCGASKYFSA
jgi:Na+/citrate or Na+/malate symporter